MHFGRVRLDELLEGRGLVAASFPVQHLQGPVQRRTIFLIAGKAEDRGNRLFLIEDGRNIGPQFKFNRRWWTGCEEERYIYQQCAV